MMINQFFPEPLAKVDRLLQLMVLCHRRTPEWARVCRIERLPRFEANSRKLPHLGLFDHLRDREVARRIHWVVENLDQPWGIEMRYGQPAGIRFESGVEAVRYSIRFGPA